MKHEFEILSKSVLASDGRFYRFTRRAACVNYSRHPMGEVIAGIDFRSGYAKKDWQSEVACERRKEADRLVAKCADTAPSEYCVPDDEPA